MGAEQIAARKKKRRDSLLIAKQGRQEETQEGRSMNLNDFVVVPNNKAKSVKLNARNLQDLQVQTVTLAQESEEMEEKLQQLKERMSKEKEERGNSAGFRWKSGHSRPLNNKNDGTKSKDDRLQKLSAGKVKMRVLKDEPLTAPSQPSLPLQPPSIGLNSTKKNKLRGKLCGQCEVKTAGLVCAECTEDYCIGCFTKFHQKGALKLHRIIPIQTDLQTHVSARDVVSHFQKHVNPDCWPGADTSPTASHKSKTNPTFNAPTTQGDRTPGKETEGGAKTMQLHYHNEVFLSNSEDKRKETMKERPENKEQSGETLLQGVYDEEESARSFQEALKQWREEKSDAAGKSMTKEAMWMPVRSVSVSATATQTDLAADRGPKGWGRGEGAASIPVRVEFTESGLTYLDRLLLKKHPRTPIETCCPSLTSRSDSLPRINTEEETTNSPTAEEEDFQSYFASLFTVPVSRCKTKPQMSTAESCLIIEVLNEGDVDKAEPLDPKQRCPTGQQVLNNENTKVTQTARESSPKNKPSSCPTAATPRTSKKSIKTPSSKSQKPYCSPTVHKSKPDCRSQQLLSSLSLSNCQTEIPKSSHFSVASLPEVSPLTSATPPVPKEPLAPSPSKPFSLRSTFTLSPSSSTETTWLPRVYQSNTVQNGSDSEQSKSSWLFPEPISSVRLSLQSPQSNLQPLRQSQHPLCDPEILPSLNELQLTPSPVSPSLRALEPSPASRTCEYSDHRSTPTNEHAPVLMTFTPAASDHESNTPQMKAQSFQATSSHYVDVIQSSSWDASIEDEEELSLDSGNEMSSDSLGLALYEEDIDEEAYTQGPSMRGRQEEEAQRDPSISRLNDALVNAEQEELQSDEQEELPDPCMVMHRQSVGSGSEQSCDLDVCLPLGLDVNSGHSNAPEQSRCASLHTSQTSPGDQELTGSGNFEPSSSFTPHAEEHLLIRLMKDNHTQPTGIKIHSTTPTRRGEISATELGTSGSSLSQAKRWTLTDPSRTNSRASPLTHTIFGPALYPMSHAAQEILEICDVDKTGCEDPDLDTDTLNSLEEELRLLNKGKQDRIPVLGNARSQDQIGNHLFTRGRVSERQKEEEAAAQKDRLSVLLLP